MKISDSLIRINRILTSLNDGDEVSDLKYEYANILDNPNGLYDGEVVSCIWNSESCCWNLEIVKNGYDFISITETFSSYVSRIVKCHLNSITSLLIIFHLNYEPQKFKNLIRGIITEMNFLVLQCGELPELKAEFSKFIVYIKEKYNKTGESSPMKPISTKIKLLRSINLFTTFLLDYSDSKNTLGKPVFERDIPAFKELVINNFIDKDDRSISKETINTYFDTNKQDEKRAKKKPIELPDTYNELDDTEVEETEESNS
ncbi:hypothetical protein FW774_01680 (plasmid) [Pedobacter sp. BS3]|uniref:hypothetical protein n=1 Tax=Pedobacter sp. BS3 TaxID=2567937 RepID=UPI0011EE6A32|nr:hypothetical protein [Pedobacter sp. BS3]TZF85807.1 hypothetical protein FW774_01680 [Pedobacter sp. BS3]